MESFIRENNIIIKGRKISYRNIETGKAVNRALGLTLDKVREQFREIDYDSTYSRFRTVDDRIENCRMYPFAFAYYYFVAVNDRIPTPEGFIDQYFSLFCKEEGDTFRFKEDFVLTDRDFTFHKEELVPRILRSYNSFNRELEFLLNFRKLAKGTGIRIWYDMARDLFDGIDFIISHNGTEEGIATYVGTKRSTGFKERKNTVRHDYSEINTYDLVAVFSGPDKNVYRNGDVFTYSDKAVADLIRKIKN